MIEQLLPAARDRMRIEVQKRRQGRIASVPQFDRFQAGDQAALLFVEQAVKQENGRFEVIVGHGERAGIGDQRDRVHRATDPDLIFRAPRVGGGVQKATGEGDAAQSTLPHEIVQRILHIDVEPIGEFIGQPALRRPADPRRERMHERAVPGEPDRLVGPQAVVVKASDLTESPAAQGPGHTRCVVRRAVRCDDDQAGRDDW